jgi:uncharacterized protein (UPF0216 family)
MNSVLDKFLEEELRIANKHLPYQKIGLCEALNMDKPEVVLRDGSTHRFDKRELQLLKDLLGELACDVQVPVIIYYQYGLGKGIYYVAGKLEASLVSKLLGEKPAYTDREKIFLSRPEVIYIRTILRTTSTVAFIP